jgi:hypothetical protein
MIAIIVLPQFYNNENGRFAILDGKAPVLSTAIA